MALKRAGHTVDGWNRSSAPLEFALKNSVIDNKVQNFKEYDVVFVALPPQATVDFINNTRFKDGCIVADICGVKKWVEDEVFSKERNFRYVGCHPMAGKETSGIESACAELFDNASMIITSCVRTDKTALETMRSLTKDMGFGRIVECSAEIHDRKIAYTSQLAHVLSNAYVKDGEIDCCLGFTGGSFQDMTRIGGVDENVWSALYLKNSDNIIQKIASLINSLAEIMHAIDDGNEENLKKVLKNGRLLFEESKTVKSNKDILITELK